MMMNVLSNNTFMTSVSLSKASMFISFFAILDILNVLLSEKNLKNMLRDTFSLCCTIHCIALI